MDDSLQVAFRDLKFFTEVHLLAFMSSDLEGGVVDARVPWVVQCRSSSGLPQRGLNCRNFRGGAGCRSAATS
jgi:hypothetical protein